MNYSMHPYTKPIISIDTTIRPSQRVLKNSSIEKYIINLLNQHWPGVNIVNNRLRNPSPNPASLTMQNIKMISEEPYLMSEKSDGVRYMFLMFIHPSTGVEYSIMMNRALEMYKISVCANKEYFKGTIMDGELVRDKAIKNKLVFKIFDAVIVAGNNIANDKLSERLEWVKEAVDIPHFHFEAHQDDDQVENILNQLKLKKEMIAQLTKNGKLVPLSTDKNDIEFVCKLFYPVEQISVMTNHLIGNNSDGIIFMPENQPIRAYTHNSCLKWKSNHTLDLWLELNPTRNEEKREVNCRLAFGDDSNIQQFSAELPLYYACGGIWYHDIFLTMKDQMKETESPKANDGFLRVYLLLDEKGQIAQNLIQQATYENKLTKHICELSLTWCTDEVENMAFRIMHGIVGDFTIVKCKVVKVRGDKKCPNNFKTFQQTLLNTRENIQLDYLQGALTTTHSL